jgi:hypothetical protein
MKCEICPNDATAFLNPEHDILRNSMGVLASYGTVEHKRTTFLCPAHYKQVKDFIEGLKQCGCGIRCPECGVWAVKVDVNVRGFKCSSCGEQYPSLSNIDGLKPVFPKMAQPRGDELPYSAVCHRIVAAHDEGVYVIIGDDGVQTRVRSLPSDFANALYEHMRSERCPTSSQS